jgi:hypothetical protein
VDEDTYVEGETVEMAHRPANNSVGLSEQPNSSVGLTEHVREGVDVTAFLVLDVECEILHVAYRLVDQVDGRTQPRHALCHLKSIFKAFHNGSAMENEPELGLQGKVISRKYNRTEEANSIPLDRDTVGESGEEQDVRRMLGPTLASSIRGCRPPGV